MLWCWTVKSWKLRAIARENFILFPLGNSVYKCCSNGGVKGDPRTGKIASILCAVCPWTNPCVQQRHHFAKDVYALHQVVGLLIYFSVQ